MRASRHKVALATVIVVTLVSTGVAYAAYRLNGRGTASAPAAGRLSLQAVGSLNPGKALYPGGAGDLVADVTNGNPYPVKVLNVQMSSDIQVDQGHLSCPASTVSLVTSGGFGARADLDVVIPARSTQRIIVPDAITMSASAAQGCSGASFTIPVIFVAQSS